MLNNFSENLLFELSKSYQDVDVDLSLASQILDLDIDITRVVGELVTNSVEKGAKRIEVILDGSVVRVNDDYTHPTQEIFEIINNVNREIPNSTKPLGSYGQLEHGYGIFFARKTLQENGHSLEYISDDNRIVARIVIGGF